MRSKGRVESFFERACVCEQSEHRVEVLIVSIFRTGVIFAVVR